MNTIQSLKEMTEGLNALKCKGESILATLKQHFPEMAVKHVTLDVEKSTSTHLVYKFFGNYLHFRILLKLADQNPTGFIEFAMCDGSSTGKTYIRNCEYNDVGVTGSGFQKLQQSLNPYIFTEEFFLQAFTQLTSHVDFLLYPENSGD
jgi:hypothetical protein